MFLGIFKSLRKSRSRKSARNSSQGRLSALRMERLEDRRVLATNLGAIEGLVFEDANNNGMLEGSEVGLAGVTVQISGGALSGPLTDVTDSSGMYSFTGLEAGTYTVEQLPPPPAGFTPRVGSSPQTVTITAADATGRMGLMIDDFDGATQDISAENPATATNPNPNQDSIADVNAIGGFRDVTVESLSNPGRASILSNIPGNPGVLAFDPLNNSVGEYSVTWDGDNDPTVLMATGGLNGGAGVDLTDSGLSDQFQLFMGIQGAGQSATIRVHSAGGAISESTFAFPNSLMPNQEVLVPFSSFAQSGGASGPADFENVTAIELMHTATLMAADAAIDLAKLLGPGVVEANFANIGAVDVEVLKSVDNDSPNVGDTVTFTVAARNNGPGTATSVEVQDVVPAGLTLTSSTPMQGTYNATNGVWDIGTLAPGASVTLQLEATVDVTTKVINTATLTGLAEEDGNSANNSAMAMLTAQSVDLAVDKAVSNSTPTVGETITYTINVTNNGPSDATGVSYQDILPAGLTFVGSSASIGSFNNGAGVWTIGAIPNGGGATLTIQAQVDAAAVITNDVSLLTVDQIDTVASNNADSVPISPQANELDLAVSKTVNDTSPALNQLVAFTVTVTNNGPIMATDVRVNDTLPSGIAFDSSTASQGSYSAATGVWNVGPLASGAGAQLVINGRPTTTTKQVNNASLDTASLDQTDTNAANNDAMAMLTAEAPELFGKRRFLASSYR